jgi:hypothetical protein
MSLDLMRQMVTDRLKEEVERRTNEAVNVRVMKFQTVDQLALSQVELLSEARALFFAEEIVRSVFLKLSKPENTPAEQSTPKTDRKAMY